MRGIGIDKDRPQAHFAQHPYAVAHAGAIHSALEGGTTQWPSVLATTMTPLDANFSKPVSCMCSDNMVESAKSRLRPPTNKPSGSSVLPFNGESMTNTYPSKPQWPYNT